MEMNLFTHVILLIMILLYAAVNAILVARRDKRQIKSGVTSESRLKRYKRGIMKGIISTAIVLLIVLFSSISFYDIGFRAVSLTYNLWFTVITLVLCGAIVINSLHQLIMPLVSEKYRQKIKGKSAQYEQSLLPHNKKERLWWIGVSMKAGISEEILCRGFLFYLFIAKPIPFASLKAQIVMKPIEPQM